MEEIKDSVSEIIKNRITNPVYFHLLIFTAIVHWKFFITLFFVSEENILSQTGSLKTDYLSKALFDVSNWNAIIWSLTVCSLPFIFTYLAIWWLPKLVFLRAIDKDEEYEVDKKMIKISKRRKIVQEEAELEEQTAKKVTAVAKQMVEKKKIEKADPRLEWENDFQKFKVSRYYNNYPSLLRNLYSGQSHLSQLDPGYVSYFDAMGLLNIDEQRNKVNSLTEKGKYFASKLM